MRPIELEMNRRATNLLIDVISFIAFLASTASGLVLWLALSGGGYGFRGGRVAVAEDLFWGLSHQEWLAFHLWTSLILAVLILIHIALHRRWIRNICEMRERR